MRGSVRLGLTRSAVLGQARADKTHGARARINLTTPRLRYNQIAAYLRPKPMIRRHCIFEPETEINDPPQMHIWGTHKSKERKLDKMEKYNIVIFSPLILLIFRPS